MNKNILKGIVPGMVVFGQDLIDAKHTGTVMHQMVEKYHSDMTPWATLDVMSMFNVIAQIPYHADPPDIELLKRPTYTMNQIGPGGDCDDKAICFASWALINKIPYRFLGVGRKKRGHRFFSKVLLSHVFAQVYIYGQWLTVDATYPLNVIGSNLGGYDRVEIL